MKHILFISHTARLEAGTSRALLRLMKYLRSEFEPIVIVDTLPGDLPGALLEMKIPCLRLPVRTIGFLPSLIYTIKKEKIDLVYGNGFNGRSMISLIAAKITGRPFICHVHETLSSVSKTWWLSYANLLIANSEHTAEQIKKYTKQRNVITVPNGIEITEFSISQIDAHNLICNELDVNLDCAIIINVGSLCSRKNQLHTIEAADKVIAHLPNTYYVFLGAWQEKKYLEEMYAKISELKIEKNIRLLGFKKNIAMYICGADVLLHTAKIEPQGQIILEAMAASLPVVAYDVGGVGEAVVQGETGFLRPFGDIDGLSSDVISLLENKVIRQQMGKAGYQRVQKHFTTESTGRQITKAIVDLLPKS